MISLPLGQIQLPKSLPKLEAASHHLAGAINDDLYWLTESQKRQFIDPFTSGTLAYLLLTEFLKAAALAAGAGLGKLVWDAVVHLAREILAGRQTSDPEKLQKEAEYLDEARQLEAGQAMPARTVGGTEVKLICHLAKRRGPRLPAPCSTRPQVSAYA